MKAIQICLVLVLGFSLVGCDEESKPAPEKKSVCTVTQGAANRASCTVRQSQLEEVINASN